MPAKNAVNHRLWLWVSIVVWTTIVSGSQLWNLHLSEVQMIALAANEANAYFNKDKAIRIWSASHGGVYVPADERTPPNPYLSHIPERDVVTPSGKQLTLMNPAYMLAQMMDDYNQLYGVKGKITSFPEMLLNPKNMPDMWELHALKHFRDGSSVESGLSMLGDDDYYRLMRPLYIQQECMKCHAFQNYHVGDLRGGVSVSVSMAPFREAASASINTLYLSHAFLWLFGVVLFGYIYRLARIREFERRRGEIKLLRLNKKLKVLSFLDGLTTISNRRSFNKAVDREWRRCRRDRKPISLVMIDIDKFKDYNDLYGHLLGDKCLKDVAQAIATVLKRAGDMVARYGGEEFVLLLPGTALEQAISLAEECRQAVLGLAIEFRLSRVVDVVSISLGVCSTTPAANTSLYDLIINADKALYRAKESGRNRVESASF